ncbi:MAG: YlxR family protein [Oscillospiraceae bacterium]|nr:YlxR family protein [Oscillospiraceae bacterium]
MTPKKIPMRMCLGCNEMKPKRELIRVVHQKDGTILLDATGKQAGRGAYICPQLSCLKAARKARRLEKAFSCRISDEIYAALEASMQEAENAPREEAQNA